MDTQAQMQAIVDRLVGVPPETLPPPWDLDEPWRTIYRRITRAGDRSEAGTLIWKATERLGDLEERRWRTRVLCNLLPGDDVFTAFPSLHEMAGQFPSVDWLWPSWIPRGLLTLLGAAPGAGKSLVALDLARRIIHGQPFPDGAPVPCPGGNVLIVDAEGAPALLNQRARAWDIDCRRLFLMLAPGPDSLIDLAHPGQQDQFREMCRLLEPALVVVDSLAAATTRGETSLQGARAILGFLSSVARDGDLALLLIHHLRKRTRSGRGRSAPQVVADDLRGSSHISAAARSVLALSLPARAFTAPALPPPGPAPGGSGPAPGGSGPAPGGPGPAPGGPGPAPEDRPASATPQAHPQSGLGEQRRLEVVKTNLCRQPPPLGLILEGENLPVPTLRYTGYVEPPPPPPRQLDLCARWLLQFLAGAGEPVKPADVVRAASEMGFPRPTLYRARQALAGSILDLGSSPHDPHKRWTLASSSRDLS